MTEMWLLLKCPERIIWADLLFSSRRPPSMSSRGRLPLLLPRPPVPSLPAPAHRFPIPPSSLRVSVQQRQPFCQAGLTRGRSFFPASESRVQNGIALHQGSLRSFMAVAGVGEPIQHQQLIYDTNIGFTFILNLKKRQIVPSLDRL